MDIRAFAEGMAIYKSMGGKNLDETDLKIWYGMVREIKPEHWEKAVVQVCERTDLAKLNFVGEVKLLVKEMVRKEIAGRMLELPAPGDDCIPAEEFKQFKREFFREFGSYAQGSTE